MSKSIPGYRCEKLARASYIGCADHRGSAKSKANPAVRIHVGRRSLRGWAVFSCSGVGCFGVPLICYTIAAWLSACRPTAYVLLVPCFPVTSNVISWLIAEERLPADVSIIVITPVEFILLQVRLAAYCAAFVVLAILMVEGAWRGGKNPALKMRLDELKANAPKPTKAAIGTFLAVILLGVGGIGYAWNLLIPMLLEYLTSDAQNAGLATQWRLASYVGFVANLAVASSIGFQAPVVTLLVLRLEVVTRTQVRRYRRHIWFTAFVLGAFLSPPDPLSLFLVAMPVIILFEFALVFDAMTRANAS